MINVTVSDCLRYCLCIIFLGTLETATAQYETANWIFNEYTLRFTDQEPAVTAPAFPNNDGEFASYSSDIGQLLIATDGSTVWNGEGKIMKNGINITAYRTRSIIIPKPGSNNQFYIFSYNAFNVPGNNNNTLSVIVYAIVDLSANSGQGEVIEKNKVLYNNMHGTFTISGKCDRSVFWLVGDVDTNLTEGTDKIYIFQIDKNGIQGPFTSKPLTIGTGSNFKLSPDARRLLFTATGSSGSGSLIADFKPDLLPADPFINPKYLPATGGGEFSANGRFIYIVGSNRVIQYDSQSATALEIFASTDILGIPQMAANGKIYIPVGSKQKLLVVNKPELPGFQCDFNEAGISIPEESFVLPSFASNLFYSGQFAANAGSDKVICEGESVVIGSEENMVTTFSWSPADYLDDPNKQQPRFQYTATGIESFIYKLTTSFEGCEHNDLVVIKINATPDLPVIYGSRSVCPGIEGVQYWSDVEEETKYLWSVSGGVVNGSNDLDTLSVNWGPLNSSAKVELQVIDPQQCKSEIATLDVLINAELQTEMPQGLDSVCVNLRNNHLYQIPKTNGSIYKWGLVGGELISNADINKVSVNWQEGVPGKIWVTEKSITQEATCLGNSDTLNVAVFKDPSSVILDYVSVDELDEKRIHLQASTSHPGRIREVSILSRKEGAGVWDEIGMVEVRPTIEFTSDNFQTDDYGYEFQVDILNKCEERLSSSIHNLILLEAAGDEERNSIAMRWRSYRSWTLGETSYEVLKALKEPTEFVQEEVVSDTSTFLSAAEGFFYFLRVRAVRGDGQFRSLSNVVKLEFNHEVIIPNVITPNQDGYNDTFEIMNIKLYPLSRLIIVNRYGQTLLDQHGYQGGWDGDDGSPGVYYYSLSVPEKQMVYKGWIQVIR